ncbi:hypothetical protein B0H66DRAFT_569750 [Apodospora peruviana]|uniref:Uncharacterized protein n=1 Tax=Apodospora peruviana TaxID=516989 RepID=A0AAE0HWF3_9PEZI|nr:hypothetical protein B0H66DRAFT_569750 [Apodospora peruviana]
MNNYNNERGTVRHNNIPASQISGPTVGESRASGPAPTTAGHHHHDILNKLDPRVDSTKDKRTMHSSAGAPEGTYGPHKSRIANALDPRVDSDMDSTAGPRAGGSGPMMHGAAGGNSAAPEGTYGPHSSRLANALDPRVDSDADRSNHHAGGAGGMTGAGGYVGQQHHGYGAGASSGMTSTHAGGHHNNRQAAAALSGPGPAPNTAGPHKSDLLNRLDPTVDSKAGTARDPRVRDGAYGGGRYR